MWKKVICRLFHRKYREVGISEAADISKSHQVWQCQWWCKKCGNSWRIWTTIEMLEEPKWDPSVPDFIELGRQAKEANRAQRDSFPQFRRRAEGGPLTVKEKVDA